jgi:hypothetical protein
VSDCLEIVAAARRGITRAELLALVAVAAVLIALVVPLMTSGSKKAREEAALAQCKENLRAIGVGMLGYMKVGDGGLPVAETVENPHGELVQALVPKFVSDAKAFYCPAETQPELVYSEEHVKAGVIGYFYYCADEVSGDERLSKFLRMDLAWPRELKGGDDPKSWVMSDAWFSGDATAHAGYRKGVNFLMLDGAVDFVGESPRQAFH